MATLTRQQALAFVEDKLRVTDIEVKLEQDALATLNAIIRAFQRELPFQNLSMLAAEPRHVPTLEEIIASGLECQGGVCMNGAVFMCVVLLALDYNCHLVAGTYSATPENPDTHVMVVVRDLDDNYEESLHLVDIACGYPTFQAIPLHKLPQKYHFSGLEIKYVFSNGRYRRLHGNGDEPPVDEACVMVDNWRQVFDFTAEPRTFEYFIRPMECIFCLDNWFLSDIKAVRFPGKGHAMVAASYRNEKARILEVEDHISEEQQLVLKKETVSKDKLLNYLLRNFPMIKPPIVRQAVEKAMGNQ